MYKAFPFETGHFSEYHLCAAVLQAKPSRRGKRLLRRWHAILLLVTEAVVPDSGRHCRGGEGREDGHATLLRLLTPARAARILQTFCSVLGEKERGANRSCENVLNKQDWRE